MKKLTTLVFLLLFVNAFSQSTYKVEYFIDIDKGYNSNTFFNVAAGDDIVLNKTISLTETSEGLHTLFLRVNDEDSNWSSTLITHFLCTDMHNWQIDEVEYFIDTDPGYGNANKLSASENDLLLEETIVLDDISDGIHTLYIRAKDEKGYWTTTHMSHFISKTVSKWNVTDLEYFIDNDPGVGNASKMDFAKGEKDFIVTKTINLDNIGDGLHTLFIRAKDENENWSSTFVSHFICEDMDKWKINEIEYFIDDDPGLGEATKINFSKSSKLLLNLNIDLNSFTEGVHTITFRSKNNLKIWSRNYVFNFEIKEGLAVTNFENKNLIAYPSPTTGQFTIEFENALNRIEVVITDLSGRVISDEKFRNTDKIIGNINGDNGIYIVYIFSENKIKRIFKIEKI